MKYTFIILLTLLYFIQNPFVSVKADEGDNCTYPESCDAEGKPGQWTCNGTIQGGSCKYDDSVDAQCSSCEPLPTPDPDEPTAVPTEPEPSAPPTPTIPPNPVKNAMENWEKGSAPEEMRSKPPVTNFFDNIKGFLVGLFRSNKNDAERLYNSAETSQQVTAPAEVQTPPSDSGSLVDRFKSFFGGPGLFSNLPEFNEPSTEEEQVKSVEKTWFPEEIKPITGIGTT